MPVQCLTGQWPDDALRHWVPIIEDESEQNGLEQIGQRDPASRRRRKRDTGLVL